MAEKMTIAERFEMVDGEHCNFDLIENKRSDRPDLHAFLLIDELFPSPGNNVIASASIDTEELYLDVDFHQIEGLTDEQILELVRCGVSYDESDYCLCFCP